MNDPNPYASPEPPPQAPPAVPLQPRFSLLALFVFMTGCAVLFGVIAALKMTVWGAIWGFIAIPLFCAGVIGLLEFIATLRGERRGT